MVFTFNMTFTVLGHNACPIFLVTSPFVYEQRSVWRSSIQNDAILQRQKVMKEVDLKIRLDSIKKAFKGLLKAHSGEIPTKKLL